MFRQEPAQDFQKLRPQEKQWWAEEYNHVSEWKAAIIYALVVLRSHRPQQEVRPYAGYRVVQ